MLQEMSKAGLRPANIYELLALGLKYPELKDKRPIIALGSRYVIKWLGTEPGVPFMGGLFKEQQLDLYSRYGAAFDERPPGMKTYPDYFRFAGVKKAGI